jgi:hypothetical protein
MADLATAWAKVSDPGTLIISGNFERASGTGRVFFEDERDVFPLQVGFLSAVFLCGF